MFLLRYTIAYVYIHRLFICRTKIQTFLYEGTLYNAILCSILPATTIIKGFIPVLHAWNILNIKYNFRLDFFVCHLVENQKQ